MDLIVKPFKNEHASRQKPPEGYVRFKRGDLPGAPSGISAIFGIRPDGVGEIQSLRFNKKDFTVPAAKKWLSDHGYKTGGFEPAIGTKVDKVSVSYNVEISKLDADQQLAFGWLYVTKKADGAGVVDHSGETISIEELEKAGYAFTLNSRKAKAMHVGEDVGSLAEIFISTQEKRKAMGIPEGVIPDGIWIGIRVDDEETWKDVKSGRFKMFSLGGKAIRRTLEEVGEGE